MSYILNRGSKGRPPPPQRRPQISTMPRSRLLPSRTVAGSGGGGQVQIQKPKEQQMEERVNQTMSMDRVLADLRILEAQQQESVRKLAAAQQLKKRRQEALAHTESRLEEMKYRNGQLQASIDSSNETLAINQRRLLVLKERGRERRDELTLLDEEVTMNVEAVQHLIISGRRYEAHVNLYAKKVGVLALMAEESRKEVERLQNELQTIQANQDALRRSIRHHDDLIQTLTCEINDLRQQIVVAEQNVTAAVNEHNSLVSQSEDLMRQSREEEARHDQQVSSIRQEIKELRETTNLLNKEKKALLVAIDETNKKAHASWLEIVEIQKAEGHVLSRLPSETSTPPVIDLKMIEDSCEKESVAVEEEKRAEEELQKSVDSMQARLNELRLQNNETRKEMEAALANKTDELAKQETRKKEKLKMIEEVVETEKNVSDIESATAPLREMLEADRLVRKEELERILADAERQRALYSEEVVKLHNLEEQVAKKREIDEMARKNLLDDIAKASERSKNIDEITRGLEKLSKHGFGVDEIAQRRKDAVTAQDEIDRCLKKYPQLADLPMNYRKDLSSTEQIAIDLADLFESTRAKETELKAIKEGHKLAKKNAKKAKATTHPRRAKDAYRSEHSKDSESLAKPQSLLDKFVQASQDVNESDNEDQIPFDDFSKADTVHSIVEKRVHWDSRTVETEETEKAHNLESQPQRSSFKSARHLSANKKSTFGLERSDRNYNEGITKDVVGGKGMSSHHHGKAKDSSNAPANNGDNTGVRSQSSSHDTNRKATTKQTKPSNRAGFSRTHQNRDDAKMLKVKASREAPGSSSARSETHSKRYDGKSAQKSDELKQKLPARRSEESEAKKPRVAALDESHIASKNVSNQITKHGGSAMATKTKLPAKRKSDEDHATINTQESKRRRRRPKSKGSLFKHGEPDMSFS